ncbi:hypothetical protein QR680_012256 [Steinernema hermaphroditum]|uniref:Bromo domain-containing protein n=1 Tax=Steinernema hermaphroditum TaxID=289476 RepID=A0AA39LZJ4_9BILA|nr:hypothetical protein QR680_012256 [Steinernema hermaphroditum]
MNGEPPEDVVMEDAISGGDEAMMDGSWAAIQNGAFSDEDSFMDGDHINTSRPLTNGLPLQASHPSAAGAVNNRKESESSGYSEEPYDEYFSNHPSARNIPYYEVEGYRDTADEHDQLEIPSVETMVLDQDAEEPPRREFIAPSRREDAPLACIVPPEIEDIDPRRFFPEFETNKVLRLTRLFEHNIKETSKTQIWWTCETFYKRAPKDGSSSKAPTEKGEFKLKIAPRPPLSDCVEDGRLALLKPLVAKGKAGTHAGSDDEEDVEPWRNGPAKMWYDKIGIPSTAKSCDYGLTMRKQQEAKNSKKLKNRHSDSQDGTGIEKDKASADSDESDGEQDKEQEPTEPAIKPADIPADVFLPVNLNHWEDDVIFNDEQARDMVVKNMENLKNPKCGWIPTQQTRTFDHFVAAVKNKTFEQMFSRTASSSQTNEVYDVANTRPVGSIFPLDNYDLLNTRWEDDVIIDPNNIDKLPPPRVLTLDYTDDPKIFGIPEDKPNEDRAHDSEGHAAPKAFDRKEHQFTKKSKMILGQVQQRQKQEEEEQLESNMAQMTDKDPFNISNDEYYMPKATKTTGTGAGSTLIQHSIPAQNLHRAFFPTHLGTYKLRHYHRMPLMKKHVRWIGIGKYITVQPLEKYVKQMEELREKQKADEGGGEIFFMREVQDLSGKDGTLLLLEYSEEHPPLISQSGMASRIRNYHKRKAGNDNEPDFEFGEKAFVHTTPFLGNLAPGQSIQSIENMLFRAPIYRHSSKRTDFLLIRSKNGFFIRNCPRMFLVGQQCPLVEVPSPNSKKASVFVRDFLMAFIYRLFWNSEYKPRRLKMEDIKAAFPHYAESSVRKRLKQCSDFKRLGSGQDQNFWVLRDDFRLPSKEEVMSLVTPEHCCAQYSMMAAEQRLKDAGYGERYAFAPENEDDSDDQVTIEDEIKCAPWNTTRCFIQSSKGRCLLDQTGIADPTGCGQGFSYVRVSSKPQKEDVPQMPKRLVTGTNADLRKLPLKEAKEICREYGVREEEINSLSRWEIIDVIRTLSTQAAKTKGEGKGELSGMARFARGNIRFNFADLQEKYKKYCQTIFESQNLNLSNPEILSTDEGSSGEDSDNDELARNLENMLKASKGKASKERQKKEFDDEEKERRELQKMLQGEVTPPKASKEGEKPAEPSEANANNAGGSSTIPKKLKIFRTFINDDGTESVRIEVINKPALIDAYLKIRNERDQDFIRTYAQMDEQYKEEKRKEKRRLQDQLRRIRRNQAKANDPNAAQKKPAVEKKPPKPINPNLLKMRCSACHGTGHMKTNKNCPLYGKEKSATKTIGEMLQQKEGPQDSEAESSQTSGAELIQMEGMKMKLLNVQKLKEKEPEKKTPLRLHIPRHILEEQQAKQTPAKPEEALPTTESVISLVDLDTGDESMDDAASTSTTASNLAAGKATKKKRKSVQEDIYSHPIKTVHRRRIDPKVSMGTIFTDIVNEMKLLDGADYFIKAVNPKIVPDYHTIIKKEIHLTMIRDRINANGYELRKEFLEDVRLMYDNSRLYNGDQSLITDAAKKMFELATKRVAEHDEKLMELEKSINPLLDENDLVGFSFILDKIVQDCRNIPKSFAFHQPVDARKIARYYDVIKNPIDLSTIEANIKNHKYKTMKAFRDEFQLMWDNCMLFNGSGIYSNKAQEILNMAEAKLKQHYAELSELEANMNGGMVSYTPVSQPAEVPPASEPGPSRIAAPLDAMDSSQEPVLINEDSNMGDTEVSTVDFMDDDEDSDMGVLHDDLAMSGDEDDSDLDEDSWDPQGDLLNSTMHASGQLQNDLALTDSDDSDDEEASAAKRPKLDDLEEF